MKCYDFAVIGAGMAGASVAYELSAYGSVCVLEQESQPGFHATGRSAAIYDPSYGCEPVRKMTLASRRFLDHPPSGFCERPLLTKRGILAIANASQRESLDKFYADNQPLLGDLQRLDGKQVSDWVTVLDSKVAAGVLSPSCDDMDVAAQHQGYLALARVRGGVFALDTRVLQLNRQQGQWEITTSAGPVMAGIVVNAAGAWADNISQLAGLGRIGMLIMSRSVFTFQPPPDLVFDEWPLVMDADEGFYFKPDAGCILATPADEVDCDPSDAQVDDYQVALGVDRLEKATTLRVDRLRSSWAGLRTFAPDRNLIIGADPRAPGFFWLAGQGGYGIMSAPANAKLACSLITGSALHADLVAQQIEPDKYGVERFLGSNEPATPAQT